MFFGSCLLQVMKKSSDNYHASLDGLFSSSNLEAGLSSREGERALLVVREERAARSILEFSSPPRGLGAPVTA